MDITEERIEAAYAVADENTKRVLDILFNRNQSIKDDRPITERVKTFEDACQELNRRANNRDDAAEDILCDYESNADNICVPETVAYMKLTIIVAALNEGWSPKYTEDEYRWFPWFVLYTEAEYEDLSKERKAQCRVVGRASSNAYAYGGLAFTGASYASSSSGTHYGSRLAFKSEELASYAGKQFIDIYAVWMGIELEEKAN